MTPQYLKKYRDSLPKKPKRPSCPYAATLRLMPPLCHNPNPTGKFYINKSEPVRFINHMMGAPNQPKDWSKPSKLFHEAKKNRVIIYDRGTRKWHGCEYRPGSESPKIRQLIHLTLRGRFAKKRRHRAPSE